MTQRIDLAIELADYTDKQSPASARMPGLRSNQVDDMIYLGRINEPPPKLPGPDRCAQCKRYLPPFTWTAADNTWLCDECRDMQHRPAGRYVPPWWDPPSG